MAMYYQGSSEIQGDALQTLYLMNPNYVGYSDTQHQLFLNPAATTTTTTVHALNPVLAPHAPLPQTQQFVGFPLSHDPSRPSSVLGQQEDHIHSAQNSIPRFQYNIWGLVDQGANGNQTNTPQQTPQGLSLSLSAHQTGRLDKPIPSDHRDNFPVQSSIGIISPKNCSSPSLTATDQSNGVNTMQNVIMGSKYLMAAQELLDEVANVGKGNWQPEGAKDKGKKIKESLSTKAAAGGESGEKGGGAELTAAQRQEIQMKKAKLSSMLDEVEQRYRQYHQQMQIVVASFEQAAGIGSARSYTQLALKTILKQFRCLRATISAQIKALSKSLGEEEISLGEKPLEAGSRLKFLDHHLRQQRALHQLGMMQNNAWRPQRGLPERAVSVLRAWLFEHFLHPYPKDSDKHMLAKQTGLTRSQVSNWFINARVRLWKPMVEEMYKEEMKNQEQITSGQNNTTKLGPDDEEMGSKLNNNRTTTTARIDNQLNPLQSKLMLNLVPSPTQISASTISTNSPTGPSLQARSSFAQLLENLPEKVPKKRRNSTQDNSPSSMLSVDMEMSKARQTRENYLLANTSTSPGPGFGTYQQLAPTGFQGNNFSLSLALPPSETSQAGGHQQNSFLSSSRNFEFGTRIGLATRPAETNAAAASHPNIGFENIIDFQNRKPFPSQLLPDFVA